MLPLIIAGLVIFSVIAVIAIINGPSKENDTVNEVEARLQREERLAAIERANTLHRMEVEELRKKVREEERKRVEALEEQRKEKVRVAALVRAQRDTMLAVQKAEERRRQELEEKLADERKAKELEDELKRREQQLQDQVDEANRLAAQERAARLDAENGPLRWPTREEFQHALQSTEYSPTNFHFAIVGRAGSGKSSLINAFRNLRNKDPHAAQTGTKETTLAVARYPDPGQQPPRQWMVWYDVPGAGTHRVSHHDYFVKQGLYVFDLIILAIGDRFEEIDARILENCARFKIPSFIVRSKADMHILNSMKEYGFEQINDNLTCYERCREAFIADTNKTVEEELTRQGLPLQSVYIVSRDVLQRTYHASLHTSAWDALSKNPEKNLIHECSLVNALLAAAAERRCEPSAEQKSREWLKDSYAAVQSHFTSNNERPAARQDLTGFFAAGQVSREATIREQHTNHPPPNIRKVIYPQPTNPAELYDEILVHNPELETMLVGQPHMITPKVAMLTFYASEPPPREIRAFGALLEVVEYRERKKVVVGMGRGGRVQAGWTIGGGQRDYSAATRGGVDRGRGQGSWRGQGNRRE